MNAKAEQKERTHETILASAARLLRERGISGARVADVMKGAGLTVGGFYAHFPSKEALVDDALRNTAAAMRSQLFAGLETKDEADRAEVVLKRYLSTAHRDDVARGCPFPAVVGEIATTAGEHREVLGEQVETFAGELQAYLRSSDVLQRRHLALGLLALMYGGISLARALRGTPLSDEMIRACRAFGRIVVRS
ncbi:MAG: TetR/AcrR family transcriptional regulator, transcriptional repressor for nem operon [Myxococcales bacterium]|nr:TetR/AcrR family transcriptional regulator, transcriptional repressor for nem operon [Myxococcales bacterium]